MLQFCFWLLRPAACKLGQATTRLIKNGVKIITAAGHLHAFLSVHGIEQARESGIGLYLLGNGDCLGIRLAFFIQGWHAVVDRLTLVRLGYGI